jgi:RNA-directed DNA polymerase
MELPQIQREVLIKPSKKNVQAFYRKVSEIVKTHLSTKQEDLIAKLNPILRGWARYHQPVVAKETFSRMDSLIYWRLVRWTRRRHPNKSHPGAKAVTGSASRTGMSLLQP